MFLADKPAALVRRGNASIFMDIAVAPDENPVQVARDLNRMLESFRNG
jgi:multidrug efflux pump subunit AcrB